jgi:methyltransferase family protein
MTPTELFAAIPRLLAKDRVPVIEGWCTTDKAMDLACSVLTLRPKVCVEVGIFGGASLLPIALALRTVGNGQVIGIEPWSVEEAVKGQTGENLAWWSKIPMETIERGFMEAVVAEGLSGQVVVLKKTSDSVTPPDVIDLLHLDGNHGEQAFRDVKRFGAKVRIGGLCFLDDIGWDGGAVGRGAEWLLQNGFVRIYDRDTGAMFQRVSIPVNKGGRPRKK